MARKRPSLRDKNVFKRSKEKELDALFGVQPKSEAAEKPAAAEPKKPARRTRKKTTTAKKSAAEKPTAEKPTAKTKSASKRTTRTRKTTTRTSRKTKSSTVKTSPLEDLAALATAAEASPPTNVPAPRDPLSVSVGEPPAENLPTGEAGDVSEYDFPVALETAPGGPLTEHLPANEIGDVTDALDPLTDFPAAMDAPQFTENLPSEEIGDIDFPTAMETPPGGAPVESLPSGEIGDDTTPLDVMDFPTAAEPPDSTPVAKPSSTADDFDLSALLDSALAETPAPAKPAATETSVAPAAPATSELPAAETPPPAWTSSSVGTPTSSSISRSSAMSLGLGADDTLFDFMHTAAETPTLTFELPTDAEDLTPEEMKERRRLLQDPRIREQFVQVYNAIDALYEQILDENISVSKEITDWAHKLLAETRYIVMNYQIKYLAKAEWNIEQVKARFDRAEESARQAERWSRWLVIWGMVWFVVFVYLIFNPDFLLKYLTSNQALSDLLVPDVFLRSLFFGAIGGVAAVFHSLLKYVTKRQFDVEYVLSYFVKPFMGMIVGTLIYLMVYVVMRPFGLTPAVLQQTSGSTSRLIFEVLSYFMAAAAGFKENLAFDLLGRVLKVIFRDTDVDEEIVPPPPPGPFSAEITGAK